MSFLPARHLIAALFLLLAMTSLRQPAWAQLDSREAISLQNQGRPALSRTKIRTRKQDKNDITAAGLHRRSPPQDVPNLRQRS